MGGCGLVTCRSMRSSRSRGPSSSSSTSELWLLASVATPGRDGCCVHPSLVLKPQNFSRYLVDFLLPGKIGLESTAQDHGRFESTHILVLRQNARPYYTQTNQSIRKCDVPPNHSGRLRPDGIKISHV